MRRMMATVAVLACTLALSAGCSDEEKKSPAGSAETLTIDVTFSDNTVTPNGERVEVEVGQPIELVITADEGGEIHVHSSPEQEFEYDAGTTTLELTIEQPGLVDVESHSPEQTIVQLEVR